MGKSCWDFLRDHVGYAQDRPTRGRDMRAFIIYFPFLIGRRLYQLFHTSSLQRQVLGCQQKPSGREEERCRFLRLKTAYHAMGKLQWAKGIWCRASTAYTTPMVKKKLGPLMACSISKDSNSRDHFFSRISAEALGVPLIGQTHVT